MIARLSLRMALGSTLVLGLAAPLLAGCADANDDPDGGAFDAGLPDGSIATTLSISSVLPAQGPIEGGTLVLVSGTGFQSGASVSFGSAPGTSVTVISTHQLRVTTPAAPGGASGQVSVTVENPDGEQATLTGGFDYRGSDPAAIDWCKLQHPASLSVAPGVETAPVFGLIYEQGCSEGDSHCSAVTAQLGVGPAGQDPQAAPDAFDWVEATYNSGHTGDDNDEYMATYTPNVEGTFAYAYRVSVDSGETWTYCDLGGSSDGFQADQQGVLTVAQDQLSVGWCNLQVPASTSASPGATTETIYGQVFVAGCTENDAQCAALAAELGVGPSGVDPSATPSAFTWTAASFNSAHSGDANSEYLATATAPGAEGSYRYLYRVSVDEGATWTYCDLGAGTNDGLQLEQLGTLTVGVPRVDWCRLQWPASTATVPGVTTELIYARTWVDGCTAGAAQCPGVTAQIGFGAADVDPSATPASFTWQDAAYNSDHTGDDDDEYMTAITPTAAGDFRYAARFSRDAGESWQYCDLENGSGDGFQLAMEGVLTVAQAVTIGWCNVQWPVELGVSTPIAPGASAGLVYGRVFAEGCTPGASACAGIRGQLGWGGVSSDPETTPAAYTWIDATYNEGSCSDCGDNDEYQAELTIPTAGSYGYAYRFSGDGGQSWVTCDTTGAPPFASADVGHITITAP